MYRLSTTFVGKFGKNSKRAVSTLHNTLKQLMHKERYVWRDTIRTVHFNMSRRKALIIHISTLYL